MASTTVAAEPGSASRPDRRGAVAGALIVFAVACGVFAASTHLIQHPPAWLTFEFCQYAEIGRNLAADGRFDTRLVEPMALAYIDEHARPGRNDGARWPVINRYPLPALVVAGLMTALGPTDRAAAWSNGLALAGVAALTYLLARRWYGRGWGVAAAVLIVANPAVFGYFALLGTPDPWFALVFLLELLAWCRVVGEPRPTRPGEIAAGLGLGALAGLAYLARFNAILFLAVQAAVLLARRRVVAVLGAAAGLLVVTAPLLAYNVAHFGRPSVGVYSAWNLLDGVGAFAVEPWLYYRVPDLTAALQAHAAGLARKWARNLFEVVPSRLWTLWDLLLLWPLALLGLVVTPWSRAAAPQQAVARRFLAWGAALFGLQLVVFSALRLEFEPRLSPHHGRYFFWFAPVAVLLAVGLLRRLAATHLLGRAAAVLVVLAQVGLFAPTWWSWIQQNREPTNIGHDPIRGMLKQVVVPGRVVASNQPQVLAWACGLKAISMPADPGELERLNRASPTPVDYVFLDLNYNCIQLDNRWADVIEPRPGIPPAWEPALLREYDFVFPTDQTRPLHYVLLRRRGLPKSALEQEMGL